MIAHAAPLILVTSSCPGHTHSGKMPSMSMKSHKVPSGPLWETIVTVQKWGDLVGTVGMVFIGILAWIVILLYAYLRLTTTRRPNLKREDSEKSFLDPSSKKKKPFPSSTADPPSLYLTLVVPAYKEEKRLPKMMTETMKYLLERQEKDPSFTYEVIVVNDGSTDGTSEEALKFVSKYGTDRVRLLELAANKGKGGAVRMGCLSARGERILMVDADGATRISDMKRLEEAMDAVADGCEKAAVVVGSRAHMQADAVAERSFLRNFLMYGFHFLAVMCVRSVKDTQCGFKLFTRAAVNSLFTRVHIERWAFDVELLYIAEHLGIPLVEVAVNWQEIEGSKMIPVFSWMQMGRDLLFIKLRYVTGLWQVGQRQQPTPGKPIAADPASEAKPVPVSSASTRPKTD